MGISITGEQAAKLDKNRREGRLCAMSTRNGGCYTRASVLLTERVWTHYVGRGESHISTQTLCTRHGREIAVSGGVNFEVISAERF